MTSVPVFVSVPSKLNSLQSDIYADVLETLATLRLEPRTVGRSDHPLRSPMGEVYQLARRCSGGLILGFRQTTVTAGTHWHETRWQAEVQPPGYFPSAWNHLEAGILYSLGMPMLVFCEDGVSGGIFDRGVGNLFVHAIPPFPYSAEEHARIKTLMQDWERHVRNHYMEEAGGSVWRR